MFRSKVHGFSGGSVTRNTPSPRLRYFCSKGSCSEATQLWACNYDNCSLIGSSDAGINRGPVQSELWMQLSSGKGKKKSLTITQAQWCESGNVRWARRRWLDLKQDRSYEGIILDKYLKHKKKSKRWAFSFIYVWKGGKKRKNMVGFFITQIWILSSDFGLWIVTAGLRTLTDFPGIHGRILHFFFLFLFYLIFFRVVLLIPEPRRCSA